MYPVLTNVWMHSRAESQLTVRGLNGSTPPGGAISRSRRCCLTGVTKAVERAVLSVRHKSLVGNQ